MKFFSFLIGCVLTAVLCFTTHRAVAHRISDHAQFSVLTCTPGADLYSLFGHSAIRFQDSIGGKWIDVVYNYGTFIFDDDFYYKFAKGKLDYILSLESFANFQFEYIQSGRGIFEQVLYLTKSQKQKLFDLLEQNVLIENRTYRYDFFYDNCSTRIRDMIIRATADSDSDGLGFYAPDTAAIHGMNRINFSFVYPGNITYRQAIQRYLDFQPWSDFGIDLALGLPCDREIGKMGFMFLPDSLMNDLHFALLGDNALTGPDIELLPQEYEPSVDEFFTPAFVMMAVLIIHVLLSIIFWKKGKTYIITDRIIFFTTGILGVLVVFLWFFTDHQATKWNLNLLWASPISLLLAFAPARVVRGKFRPLLIAGFAVLLATLMLWFVLPQRMHLAAVPIVLSLILTHVKILKPQLISRNKQVG